MSRASCHGTVSGKIPKAYLKESEDSVSKCLLLAWGSLAPDKWQGGASTGGFAEENTYKQMRRGQPEQSQKCRN